MTTAFYFQSRRRRERMVLDYERITKDYPRQIETQIPQRRRARISIVIIEVKDIFNGSSFEMLFFWPLISYQPNRTKDHFPPPPSSWDNRILVKSLNSWSHKELFASLVFSVAGLVLGLPVLRRREGCVRRPKS